MDILTFFQLYQMEMLKGLGILCLVIAFFICVVKFSSRRRKTAIFIVEVSTGIMLIADMLAYHFRNDMSQVGYWGIRIANFVLYFSVYLILYGFNNYIVSLVMGRNKLKKLPFRLLLGFVLPCVGMTGIVANQFIKLLYYIDENNMYSRGDFAWIGFALPTFVLLTQLTVVLQYVKYFKPGVFISLVLYILLPGAGAAYQYLHPEVSTLSIATGIVAVSLYVFSIIEQNRSMLYAYSTDLATGLPNTNGYLDEIEKKKAKHVIKDYCSIYFDINRMSVINRKFGNDSGDRAIIEYAKAVDGSLDKGEVLARLGGNFFIALIKHKNKDKFLDFIKEVPVSVKVGKKYALIKLSATAGGFEATSNNVTPEHMIGYAAQALTLAKNVIKKPYVAMTNELLSQIEQERHVEALIPEAIENKEFVPYYQPKVDSVTNEVCGAEALIRWKRDGKIIPPGSFIPLMEKNDSICTLDFYMLDYVCKDIKQWLEFGIEPPVISVNFSRRNLGNPKFVNEVFTTVKRNEIPIKYIQIEVTETIDEYPLSTLRRVVAELQQLGFKVAIDDFGVGSSSINLLKEVAFDVIKVDKSFVDYTTERDKQLLGFIVEIAKAMNAEVVAEGVEYDVQRDQLKEMGCTIIQGYLYSKPVDKQEFEVFVNELKHINEKNKAENN